MYSNNTKCIRKKMKKGQNKFDDIQGINTSGSKIKDTKSFQSAKYYLKKTGLLSKILLLTISLILVSGCSDSSDDEEILGNWFELSDFEGVPRSGAVAFTIGEKAYIGTGYDGEDRLNDFWEYDPSNNQWTQRSDFPGSPRNGAVGFGTDTKGYIGTGYDGDNKLKDFYEYDPINDSWKEINNFPGSARYDAVAFSINNKGYICSGYDDNALKDLWEYDPSNKTWQKKASVEGGKRRNAVAFVLEGKGYISTGIDNGVYENDFWAYAPETDDWIEKRDITDVSDEEYDDEYSGITGIDKVAFTINGKGYIATGGSGSTGSSIWEYNPVLDLWEEKTGLEASARIGAVGFSIGEVGYITTGRNSSYYFDDLWGFHPSEEQIDLDKIVAAQSISDHNIFVKVE